MRISKHIRAIDWRAMSVLLMLLLWAMTPVIALELPERVDCGMACCLSEGECCCASRFDSPDDDQHLHEQATISKVELSRGCPSHCASISSSPQVASHVGHSPATTNALPAEALLPFGTRITHHQNSPTSGPSSPRAPPTVA
ncbi:MAG: hypothetical protein SF339_20115 [Blastocatellia bacterium]|nr:hypothetical protein [Blastocatellia bacterium]